VEMGRWRQLARAISLVIGEDLPAGKEPLGREAK
jgi:hypothetical protein